MKSIFKKAITCTFAQPAHCEFLVTSDMLDCVKTLYKIDPKATAFLFFMQEEQKGMLLLVDERMTVIVFHVFDAMATSDSYCDVSLSFFKRAAVLNGQYKLTISETESHHHVKNKGALLKYSYPNTEPLSRGEIRRLEQSIMQTSTSLSLSQYWPFVKRAVRQLKLKGYASSAKQDLCLYANESNLFAMVLSDVVLGLMDSGITPSEPFMLFLPQKSCELYATAFNLEADEVVLSFETNDLFTQMFSETTMMALAKTQPSNTIPMDKVLSRYENYLVDEAAVHNVHRDSLLNALELAYSMGAFFLNITLDDTLTVVAEQDGKTLQATFEYAKLGHGLPKQEAVLTTSVLKMAIDTLPKVPHLAMSVREREVTFQHTDKDDVIAFTMVAKATPR